VRIYQQELGGKQRASKTLYARRNMGREGRPTKLFLVYALAEHEKAVQFIICYRYGIS
jgi:hypothetical protein